MVLTVAGNNKRRRQNVWMLLLLISVVNVIALLRAREVINSSLNDRDLTVSDERCLNCAAEGRFSGKGASVQISDRS